MGKVYRATDTRLDRVVAIKVLPAHLAANPELRQRMECEAPNTCRRSSCKESRPTPAATTHPICCQRTGGKVVS